VKALPAGATAEAHHSLYCTPKRRSTSSSVSRECFSRKRSQSASNWHYLMDTLHAPGKDEETGTDARRARDPTWLHILPVLLQLSCLHQ
jgi:hypothetical protein